MSHSVLLVENQAPLTEQITALVQSISDCTLDIAHSPDHVSRLFSESIQVYHLAIIDLSTLHAPQDALDILQSIKRASPSTGVIFLADQPRVEMAVMAIKLGADDFLEKPINDERFQLAVKRALDRKVVYAEGSDVSIFLSLLNTCQLISATLDRNRIFKTVVSYLKRELRSAYGEVLLLQDRKLEPLQSDPKQSKEEQALADLLHLTLSNYDPGKRLRKNSPIFWFEAKTSQRPEFFCMRFSCASEEFVAFCLKPDQPEQMEAFESRLKILKNQIDLTGKNIEQYLGVQKLAYQDENTGLQNLRAFHVMLEKRIAQAETDQKPFALLFIDLDQFKTINDTLGHDTGTQILREISQHLKKYVRGTDAVFRYGGDEFVAILYPCDLETAQTVAERIRSSIEIQTFKTGDDDAARTTVSIGVAVFPHHAQNAQQLIEAADRAMYQAKRSSRNRVCTAQEAP